MLLKAAAVEPGSTCKSRCLTFWQLLLSLRYDKAFQAKEDTEESLKRRPMSAGEPEMPSQVY